MPVFRINIDITLHLQGYVVWRSDQTPTKK